MNEAKIKEALETFLQNPYWKGVYDNAPEGAKAHYRLTFYYSLNSAEISKEIEAYKAAKEEVERNMTNEDWQYLIDNTSSGMAKAQYRKRLKQE